MPTSARTAVVAVGGNALLEGGGPATIAEQFDGLIHAALAGLGVTTAYSHLVLPHLREGTLKVVLPEYIVEPADPTTFGYYIRYPHRKYLPRADRALIDFLLEHFRKLGDENPDIRPFAA